MNTAAEIRLKIADTIIQISSGHPLADLNAQEKRERVEYRFDNFIYRGKANPDIRIRLSIRKALPWVKETLASYRTYHFQDASLNWSMAERKGGFIFQCPLKNHELSAFSNSRFSEVRMFQLPKPGKGFVWELKDVTDIFLEILMINFLARHAKGVLAHGVGIRDCNGAGLLFCGRSGAGKTTTAKIWFANTKAMVLNDDRIIVRKKAKRFFIYPTPWHGEFYRNLSRPLRPARLEQVCFIYHGAKNIALSIRPEKSFGLLYQTIFPPFWKKKLLENTVVFCNDMVQQISCLRMGFKKNKRVINFVRALQRPEL